MEQKITQSELKHILPNTPETILESVYGNGEEPGIKALNEAVGQLEADIKEHGIFEGVIQFLRKEDPLTKIMYKKDSSGELIYPFANDKIAKKAAQAGIQEKTGPVGTQTSKYHHETNEEHTRAVTGRFMEAVGYGKSTEKDKIAAMTAMLHDVGKKYTAATNQKGEICFFGHEAVSAYIAAKMFADMGLSREQIEKPVAVICCHVDPKVKWTQKPEAEQEFIDKYGKDAHDKLVMLSDADVGFQSREDLEKDTGYRNAIKIANAIFHDERVHNKVVEPLKDRRKEAKVVLENATGSEENKQKEKEDNIHTGR